MHNKIIKKSLSETRTLFKRSLHISLIFMLFVDHSQDSNDFVCTNVDTPSSIRVAFLYDFAHFPEQIDWSAAVSCKPFHARNGAIHQWRKCLLKILVNVLWLDLLYSAVIFFGHSNRFVQQIILANVRSFVRVKKLQNYTFRLPFDFYPRCRSYFVLYSNWHNSMDLVAI